MTYLIPVFMQIGLGLSASYVGTILLPAGVVLARWFGDEARRVYAILSESDDDREARGLVELRPEALPGEDEARATADARFSVI